MGEWKQMKLEDLGFLQRGRSRHRPRYAFHLYGGPYPFVQTGDVREAGKYLTKYTQTYSEAGLAQSKLWPKGTICITIAANIAEVTILGLDACFPDSVLGFIANKEVADQDFIYYSLVELQKELKHIGEGSVQDNINLGTFQEVLIPTPDLPEQRAIASVLSCLDAKIDLLHRQNKTLEGMAEALFRQWFVEEAEEGWEEVTVADIADVTSGKRPQERFEVATSEARVPVWGGNGPMAYTRVALVDSEVLLTGRVGTLGSIFRINTPIWPSDNTLLLTARVPKVQEFLFQQLRNIDFAQLNRGSTQPLLTQSDLKSQSFLMPPDELLTKYHELARWWYAKVDANMKTTETLTALRDTLLPKLMSGEVRVENAMNTA